MAITIHQNPIPSGASFSVGPVPAGTAESPAVGPDYQRVVNAFEDAFGQSFVIVDASSGSAVQSKADGLSWDFSTRLSQCEEIARRRRPTVLDEVAPLLMLAVPLPVGPLDPPLIAVSTFVTDRVADEKQIAAAAAAFGVDAKTAFQWAQAKSLWPQQAVLQTSIAITEKLAAQQNALQLKKQVAEISSHLLNTFEEITLLHRLTEQLSISQSVVGLCEQSVKWLSEVIPARSIAVWLNDTAESRNLHNSSNSAEHGSLLIHHGESPLDAGEFDRFVERLGPHVATEALVLNRTATESPTWFYPDVRELISVPIREGDHLFGWLFAMNHTGAGDTANSEVEFGTVEASLLSSVATILGIHGGNITLYQEQADFFASVVRALTSAIDAKDPYTCGHSDRVARLSVCLARRMGCSSEDLDTIYLSGLLHDIGKIGIDDNVLRKPGALTDEEFDHIKTHPALGFKILDGIKQLDKVLPIVLHHHEAWDGRGYPAGLKGEECPQLARIVAVADSIDAMSSDRPYRKGMPDEKLDEILQEGSGRQWDAQVINAVFQVREEIRSIGTFDRQPLSLSVERWQAGGESEAQPATEDEPPTEEQPA